MWRHVRGSHFVLNWPDSELNTDFGFVVPNGGSKCEVGGLKWNFKVDA